MTEFFVTLPSNSDPNNKTGDFTVHLPKTIPLDGSYEVGLSEIIYPHTWVNLPKYYEKTTHQNSTSIFIALQTNETIVINVTDAHFETIQELLPAISLATKEAANEFMLRTQRSKRSVAPEERDEIEADMAQDEDRFRKEQAFQRIRKIEMMRNFEEKLKFTYDPIIKRIVVQFDQKTIRAIVLSEHLQHMLGFESRVLQEPGEVAKYMVDLKSCTALYVYTNIVEPQLVGTGYFPLLRIIHVDNSQFNSTVEKIFYSPHYLNVNVKQLAFIQIQVRTDTGTLVPFQSGKIICKLHFRKKRLMLQ